MSRIHCVILEAMGPFTVAHAKVSVQGPANVKLAKFYDFSKPCEWEKKVAKSRSLPCFDCQGRHVCFSRFERGSEQNFIEFEYGIVVIFAIGPVATCRFGHRFLRIFLAFHTFTRITYFIQYAYRHRLRIASNYLFF